MSAGQNWDDHWLLPKAVQVRLSPNSATASSTPWAT